MGIFFFSFLKDWKVIAKQFEERWNFPNCLGCVDGKHIEIIPPANSGSYFYNYKGAHRQKNLDRVTATSFYWR